MQMVDRPPFRTCTLIFGCVRDRPLPGDGTQNPVPPQSEERYCPNIIVKENGVSYKVPPQKKNVSKVHFDACSL